MENAIRRERIGAVRLMQNVGLFLAISLRTIVIGQRMVRALWRHYPDRPSIFRQARRPWSDAIRRRYTWRLSRVFWAQWILNRIGLNVTIIDHHHVGKPHSRIVVANHQSAIDILLLLVVLQNGSFICKHRVVYYPVVGLIALLSGQILIDRKNRVSAMRKIRVGMEHDTNVIFFAEGERSMDGVVGPFRNGAFRMAIERQLSVLPIAIGGAHLVLQRRSVLGINPDVPVSVICGEEVVPRLGQNVVELRDSVRDSIISLLAEGEE